MTSLRIFEARRMSLSNAKRGTSCGITLGTLSNCNRTRYWSSQHEVTRVTTATVNMTEPVVIDHYSSAIITLNFISFDWKSFWNLERNLSDFQQKITWKSLCSNKISTHMILKLDEFNYIYIIGYTFLRWSLLLHLILFINLSSYVASVR